MSPVCIPPDRSPASWEVVVVDGFDCCPPLLNDIPEAADVPNVDPESTPKWNKVKISEKHYFY